MCLYEASKDQAECQERTKYKAVCRYKKLLILVLSPSQQQSELERWYRYRGWDLGCWWCSLHHWGVVPTLLPVHPLPPHQCPHQCRCQCCSFAPHYKAPPSKSPMWECYPSHPSLCLCKSVTFELMNQLLKSFQTSKSKDWHHFLLYSCWGILLLWDHRKDAYQAEWNRMQAGSIRSKNYSISASKMLSHDNF